METDGHCAHSRCSFRAAERLLPLNGPACPHPRPHQRSPVNAERGSGPYQGAAGRCTYGRIAAQRPVSVRSPGTGGSLPRVLAALALARTYPLLSKEFAVETIRLPSSRVPGCGCRQHEPSRRTCPGLGRHVLAWACRARAVAGPLTAGCRTRLQIFRRKRTLPHRLRKMGPPQPNSDPPRKRENRKGPGAFLCIDTGDLTLDFLVNPRTLRRENPYLQE